MADKGGYSRPQEVEYLLEADEFTLGEDWRSERDDLTPDEIAQRRGISIGPVRANLTLVRVLRDGFVPTGPTVAAQGRARVRSWLKTKPLSGKLREELGQSFAELDEVANNVEARERESTVAVEQSIEAEMRNVNGVYVYTLPHYLLHPVDEESGRTLLKVGHSAKDAYYRASSQGRLTALPEDPILLRIYPADESRGVERQFHSWLGDASHARSAAKRGGSEWFITSKRFLDRVASALGLIPEVINEG